MLGVFDSGSGGLTVLKEIYKQAPSLDAVYFGDLLHMPYGEKTPEELGALTVIAIEKLLSEGAENIVSACNSVSASVAQPLIDLLGRKKFEMVEMVQPTVQALKSTEHIGLVGTPATVESGLYSSAFKNVGINIQTQAIGGLVQEIEGGQDKGAIEKYVRNAVENLAERGCSTIVLGCTQYPLVADVFERAGSEFGVHIVNPAEFVAREAVKRFGTDGSGSLRFIISQDSEYFRKLVEEFFGNCDVEVL